MGGGRPGDVATPTHWNVTVSYILNFLVPSWIARGFGFRFGNSILLVLVWADDFTFIAADITQLKIMLTEFAEIVNEFGLDCKPSKSHWFANAFAWELLGKDDFKMAVDISSVRGARSSTTRANLVRSATTLEFKYSEDLEIVGGCLSSDGSSDVSLDFAVARGSYLCMSKPSRQEFYRSPRM